MNFGSNLFVVLCFISGLNAVEMKLKDPSNVQGATIQIDDPFSEQRQIQCPVKLIEITDETKKYYWVIGEITLKLATNHQTSFMIVNCSQTSAQDATQFIIDVCKALIEINKVPVGQKLLEDICQVKNEQQDLIIFDTKLFEEFQINFRDAEKIDSSIKSMLNNMPTNIKIMLGWDLQNAQNQQLFINELAGNLNNIISFQSSFSNAAASSFANECQKNAIFVKQASIKTVLWNLRTCTVQQEDEDIPLHLHLFHELNHYRHYVQNVGTYSDKGQMLSIKTGGSSSLGIINRKQCNMKLAEEELQQTGYTTIEDSDPDVPEELFDPVNEIVYRIQKKIQNSEEVLFRFPYVPIDPGKNYKASRCEIAKILLHSCYQPRYIRMFEDFIDSMWKEMMESVISDITKKQYQ